MKLNNYNNLLSSIMMLLALGWFTSCVEDEGHNTLNPINEVTISNIDKEYNILAGAEYLKINPTIESSMEKEGEYAYSWFVSFKNKEGYTEHKVLGNTKELNYLMKLAPGNYTLFFSVLDKKTHLKWEQTSNLSVSTPYSRGFYVLGTTPDGAGKLDFISTLDGRDTSYVSNILDPDFKLKDVQDIIFTGDNYRADPIALWLITKSSSYSMEWSAEQTTFGVREGVKESMLFFPTLKLERPIQVVDVLPHSFGEKCTSLSSRARIMLTKQGLFIASLFGGESYGNPINRYSLSDTELYKVSKYVFYLGNSSRVSNILLYDLTNHRFVRLNSSFMFSEYTKKFGEQEDSEKPFYFDQQKYTPVRDLVYGENGFGNQGRSYALMSDGKDYYVYGMTVGRRITKSSQNQVSSEVSSALKQATHYAFYSMQPVLLYSIGNSLWAYNYVSRINKKLKDFEGDISYLAMEYNSNNDPNAMFVATYSGGKGVIEKYQLNDDPNGVEITPVKEDRWETDMKVVKIEYRNCSK